MAELNVCMFIKWDDHVECRNLLIKFSLIKKRERDAPPKNSCPLLPHEDVVKRPAAIYEPGMGPHQTPNLLEP